MEDETVTSANSNNLNYLNGTPSENMRRIQTPSIDINC
jgi:hypothetical protein